jgi:hypothetical protein
MQGKMPIRQGITSAATSIAKEKFQPHALKFSQAATLAELCLEYVFYTPALIYMKVRLMGRDPFAQFIQEYQREVIPVSMRFNKPIFSGLSLGGDTSWNNVLFGMEVSHWDAFVAFMGTMAFLDRDLGFMARVRTKTFMIADPLYFEKAIALPREMPVVPINVFCLDTNKGCAWIEPGVHPLLDLPELKTTAKVFDDTALFAKAVMGEQDNPYKLANIAGPPEPVPRGVGPLPAREPLKIENLPGPHRDALQDLVRRYNQQRKP